MHEHGCFLVYIPPFLDFTSHTRKENYILEVRINKEVKDYQESIFFGLSLRQFIFSLLAVGIAVAVYFLLKDESLNPLYDTAMQAPMMSSTMNSGIECGF